MKSTFTAAAAAAAALLVAAALFASACADDDDAQESGSTAVISAIAILDKAGLHDIDTAINQDGKVPDTARTTALHMQAVVVLTKWPQAASGDASKLAQALGSLAKALDSATPDLEVAGAAANAVHESAHDLSHTVWDGLQKEAGIAAGANGNSGD
jgi:hypothetical protein